MPTVTIEQELIELSLVYILMNTFIARTSDKKDLTITNLLNHYRNSTFI